MKDMSERKEKSKLYIVAAAAAAVVILTLTAILLMRGGEKTYRSIRIVELDGGVTIDREGVGSLDASVNMNLISGDKVHTASGAYVVLRLDEDKYVMLGEQGAMQVEADGDKDGGRTSIRLESGSVLNEIQNPLGQNDAYEIVTPNATMSVRGTVFEVRSNGTGSDGNVEVLVYEGKVAVELGEQEPQLYGSGEYTQFTVDDDPQFLVERSAITKERMNGQMLQRLQQIEEGGRSLDFGETKLEELIGQDNSASEVPVAEIDQVQDAGVNDMLPDLERQTPVTAAPSPTPTSSAYPTSTEFPKSSPIPAPAATDSVPEGTSGPSFTVPPQWPGDLPPIPMPTSEPTTAPVPPTVAPVPPTPPVPPATPPANHPQPVDPDDTMAWWNAGQNANKGTKAEDGSIMWKAVFYMPAVVVSYEDNDGELIAQISDQQPSVYDVQLLEDSSLVRKPKEPAFNDASGAPDDLTFMGWYTEKGGEWNFNTDRINSANVYLFPAWKDKDGNLYYPLILRDPITNYYRCYSVKEGSHLYERPAVTESPEGSAAYGGYTRPSQPGYKLMTWGHTNGDANDNYAFWGNRTEKVEKFTSLMAVWFNQQSLTQESLVLFVTGSTEDGYGDLIAYSSYPQNGTIYEPIWNFSSGINLPEGATDPKEIDWKRNGVSYKDYKIEDIGQIYIFYADWGSVSSASE